MILLAIGESRNAFPTGARKTDASRTVQSTEAKSSQKIVVGNEPVVSGGLGSQRCHAQTATTPCSPGASCGKQDAARTIFQIAVRTARRLPSGYDHIRPTGLHRSPHRFGWSGHARIRGAA